MGTSWAVVVTQALFIQLDVFSLCSWYIETLDPNLSHFNLSKISGFHKGEDEGDSLLQAIAVVMEALSISETSVSFQHTTRRNITEDLSPVQYVITHSY
jgi:hypothetical protein